MRPLALPGAEELPSTRRYTPRRVLGRGGMGIVFEAWDNVQSIPVAIKTLEGQTPATVHRLKREFRSIADVSHPNLVTLHGLLQSAGTWLLVMDLVEGVGFCEHVLRAGHVPRTDSGFRQFSDVVDEARLRVGLFQVVAAVRALHEAGWLHRDIKPSNVLGNSKGHVTVLDFGLVREESESEASVEQQVVGTPVYMAPEQAAGESPGPWSDWYSVGVMLYECLTGRVPFSGSMLQVLGTKQFKDPVPPVEHSPSIPEDLNELCIKLLSREASARPNAASILTALCPEGERRKRTSSSIGLARKEPGRPHGSPLFGRKSELERLTQALRRSEGEGPLVVNIVAASGLGKTALAQSFLEQCKAQSAAVLTGRCFERESVPFKGVDGAVDSLVRYLRQLSDVDASALLPREAFALRSVFPALERVDVVKKVPAPRRAIPDTSERRRRAFLALKELLARLADRRFTVLFLDDVQWGDADGADLVAELLRPPDSPRLLLVAASRPGDPSPLAEVLLNAHQAEALDLGPMAPEATRAFARHLLQSAASPVASAGTRTDADSKPAADEQADVLAAEAAGNPLFVQELARHLTERYDATTPVRLDDALRQRVRALSPENRTLLSAIAIAGVPIATPLALRAADLGRAGERALRALYSARLVCGSESSQPPMVETQHDRIREVVCSETGLSERMRLHSRLADVLIAAESNDAEVIAVHLEEAGRTDDALRYAVDAAERAERSFAFDRSARLYRQALRLLDQRPSQGSTMKRRFRLESGLAESLAALGRGREAAESYLRAAECSVADRAECRRLAAEHYLRSGHTEQGMALLQEVLREQGLNLAKTPTHAVAKTLYHRARRSLTGIHFQERPSSTIRDEELRRADLAWTVSNGLTLVDRVRAAEFHARHLPLVLRLGDPFRAARALSLEGAMLAARGASGRRQSSTLIRHAELIAKQHHDHQAMAWVILTKGSRAYLLQRWRDAYRYTAEAEELFRNGCKNTAWELATASGFHYLASAFLGELSYISERMPAYVREVEQRGDLFARATATTGILIVAWLNPGNVTEAQKLLAETEAKCRAHAYQLSNAMLTLGLTYTNHYLGRHAEAYERIRSEWKPFRNAYLHTTELLRVQYWALRGAAALATGESRALADAERALRTISNESSPLRAAYEPLLRGGLAYRNDDLSGAVAGLDEAALAFSRLNMRFHENASRLIRGRIRGDESGHPEYASAEAWFRAQGTACPTSMARAVIPAFD